MARFFTNMSDSPTFSPQWNTGAGAVTIETSGLPSGSGTHALKIVKSAAGRYFASWDQVGSVSGDVEMLVRWQSTATPAAGAVQLILYGSGGSGSENAYFTSFRVTTPTTGMTRAKYVAGSSTTLSPDQTGISPALGANQWHWTRIQITGTTFRQRTWVESGGSEPGTWASTSTDTSLVSGAVGIGSALNSVTIWVSQIGVGTGGDPAPDAPVATDIPANLMRTQHYGPRALTGGPRGIW